MKKLFKKEIKLAASPLSFIFIAAALLTFVPGYPILVGVFFVTLGIFYSFQTMRENNDIGYSLMLPIKKSDIVKAKFLFTVFVEMCGFVIMTVITLVRMAFLSSAEVYTKNALMTANFVFLGFALTVFGLYNFFFVKGFFKTAFYFAKPFVIYCISAFLLIAAAETLWHIPHFEALNSFGFANMKIQIIALITGAVIFILLTLAAVKKSVKMFRNIDL